MTQIQSSNSAIRGIIAKVVFVIAVLMSAFQVYAAATGNVVSMPLRNMHLTFVLVLVYLTQITSRQGKLGWGDALAFVFCLGGGTAGLYAFFNWEDMIAEVAYPDVAAVILGIVLLVTVVDATRRKLGNAIPGIACFFLFYAFFGEYLPVAGHAGYSYERIIGNLTMATEGIYGPVLGIAATYIFLFVLFGAVLERSGASQFFISLAMALFGKSRGGPAKVAVVGSALFGTISGSAVANVMTVGQMTIPLMRRVGYSPVVAGAVEAVGSTGGQIMPPVMGAAAFIMAETLQVPYLTVCAAALIPAFLYYLALWFVIDMHARKEDILPLADSEIPALKEVAKSAHLGLPVVALIFFLAVMKWSPIKAGLWAIVTLLAVTSVNKETRFTPRTLMKALEAGAMGSLSVSMICAIAGIIIGVLGLTGLGLKFSQLLVEISFGFKPLLLVLTMIAGLILGMGMTTTSVYIILSVLVAPALVKMDVLAIAAHLFAFYFGILSAITPPVAVAAFAAASITKASPTTTGFMSFRFGIAGFIVPFMFIYSPELLMEGSTLDIVIALCTASVGIFSLAAAMEGWLTRHIAIPLRVLLFCSALLLIDSGVTTDIIGMCTLAFCYVISKFTKPSVFA